MIVILYAYILYMILLIIYSEIEIFIMQYKHTKTMMRLEKEYEA